MRIEKIQVYLDAVDKKKEIFSRSNSWGHAKFFFMENGGWKSLMYTTINAILSWENGDYFEEKLTWIEIVLTMFIESITYTIKKNKESLVIINSEGKKVFFTDFKAIIRDSLRLNEELIDYDYKGNAKKKNTLNSLFRFNFINDNDIRIKNKESVKEIHIINSSYDWHWRRILLAYYLWADLSRDDYFNIKKYFTNTSYIVDNKKLYDRYTSSNQNLFLDKEKTSALYASLSMERTKLWDISNAITKIDVLINKYIQSYWEDDDHKFLLKQQKLMIVRKTELEQNANKISEEIKFHKSNEVKYFGEQWFESKEMEIIHQYKTTKKELKNEKGTLETIIVGKINNHITKLNTFIAEAITKYKLSDTFWPILFNPENLSISFPNGVSEWQARAIRILLVFFIVSYSINNHWRCIDNIFFDSTTEKLDHKNMQLVIKTLHSYIDNSKTEKLSIPSLYFFITWEPWAYMKDLDWVEVINKSFLKT